MNLYPKTKKGQEKFNKIIESSIETIAKLGYSNASVGEITRNAGVSYGLFYLYFRDKDDLLDELVKKYNHEMRKYIHDTISGIEGRISIEKAGFHAFIDWVKGNTYLFQILLEAEIHRPEIYKWHYRMLGGKLFKVSGGGNGSWRNQEKRPSNSCIFTDGHGRLSGKKIHSLGRFRKILLSI